MQPNYALKAAIYRKGLRQKEVAGILGIPELELTKMVTGRRGVSPDVWQQLAQVLGVSVDEIQPKEG